MHRLFQILGVAMACTLAVSAQEESREKGKRPPDPLSGPPFVNAKAWAVADAKTGQILGGANYDTSMPMASTTKIMTALVVLKLAEKDESVLGETVRMSRFAGNTGGSSARLRPGDRVAVRDILYGLLLPSGNDAANAIAEHFGPRLQKPSKPGEVPWNARSAGRSKEWVNFVAEMNRQARKLGLKNTRFVNPHGLDSKAHYSSARDLLVLARAAMAYPGFRTRVATRTYRANVVTGSGTRRTAEWKNMNRLLGTEGYIGIKTGTTTSAGACLVSSSRREGVELILVVLNSNNRLGRYVDSRNLYRWAFHRQLVGGK